jgi:hypothetical protein
MEVWKKKESRWKILLAVCIISVISVYMTVNFTAHAAPGGLLDGKVINRGDSDTQVIDTTTLITDNNESTFENLIFGTAALNFPDHFWYEFSTPVTIDSYRLYATQKLQIYALQSDGTKVEIASSENVVTNGDQTTVSQVTDVKKIVIYNATVNNASIFEFDVSSSGPATPTPTPTPTPTSTPDPVSGRALLIVELLDGDDKEYDLSMAEVNAFISWYDSKAAGAGPERYVMEKAYNQGPFTSRKDHLLFDKILTFEVNEYSVQ